MNIESNPIFTAKMAEISANRVNELINSGFSTQEAAKYVTLKRTEEQGAVVSVEDKKFIEKCDQRLKSEKFNEEN